MRILVRVAPGAMRVHEGLIYEGDRYTMRRFLIALTLVLLVVVSVGIGVLVAGWPHWRDAGL